MFRPSNFYETKKFLKKVWRNSLDIVIYGDAISKVDPEWNFAKLLDLE